MSELSGEITIETFAEAVEVRIQELRDTLASATILITDRELLLNTSQNISHFASEVESASEIIEDTESRPKFGSEDSYWTAFRMFCVGGNAGKPFSIEQGWSRM